jgi:hypothetical protein
MFSIKFQISRSHEIFRAFFSQSFLPVLAWKTKKKTWKISQKYDAKHWARDFITRELKYDFKITLAQLCKPYAVCLSIVQCGPSMTS